MGLYLNNTAQEPVVLAQAAHLARMKLPEGVVGIGCSVLADVNKSVHSVMCEDEQEIWRHDLALHFTAHQGICAIGAHKQIIVDLICVIC